MFDSETNMSKPAARWMLSQGLIVKSEFITPWGFCDLVGLSFNEGKVRKRRQLGQKRAVSNFTQAVLLFAIPDSTSVKRVTRRSLVQEFTPTISEDSIIRFTDELIDSGFVDVGPRDRLIRVNGWVPLHKRLVAVELKLLRVEEVMSQALSNLGFADESYVGLPRDVAVRVAEKRTRWTSFFNKGVGLLAVGRRDCHVLIPSRARQPHPDRIVQFCCTEKFWRSHIRDS